MVYVYARKQVEDYRAWKNRFDADTEGRAALGSVGVEVFHVHGDTEDVVVLLELEDDQVDAATDGDTESALADLLQSGDDGSSDPELVVLNRTDEQPR